MKATALADEVKQITGTKTNEEAAEALKILKAQQGTRLPPPVGVTVVCDQKQPGHYYPYFIGVNGNDPSLALSQLEHLRSTLRHFTENTLTQQIDTFKELVLREKLAAETTGGVKGKEA